MVAQNVEGPSSFEQSEFVKWETKHRTVQTSGTVFFFFFFDQEDSVAGTVFF